MLSSFSGLLGRIQIPARSQNPSCLTPFALRLPIFLPFGVAGIPVEPSVRVVSLTCARLMITLGMSLGAGSALPPVCSPCDYGEGSRVCNLECY